MKVCGGVVVVSLSLLAAPAWAQDPASDVVPRSSSPMGFTPDNPRIDTSGGESLEGRGGAGGIAGGRPGASVEPGLPGSGVAIQGNTRVNASGREIDSTAIGARNKGCSRVGGIGECQ
jgi:hypothetical protein